MQLLSAYSLKYFECFAATPKVCSIKFTVYYLAVAAHYFVKQCAPGLRYRQQAVQ